MSETQTESPSDRWSRRMGRFAEIEGWSLFDADGGPQLQRDDVHGVFATDGDAHRYVLARAAHGDQVAAGAIEALRVDSPGEYDLVMQSRPEEGMTFEPPATHRGEEAHGARFEQALAAGEIPCIQDPALSAYVRKTYLLVAALADHVERGDCFIEAYAGREDEILNDPRAFLSGRVAAAIMDDPRGAFDGPITAGFDAIESALLRVRDEKNPSRHAAMAPGAG